MVKILSVFGILLALFPNVAYCNNSSDDKKLIVSGMKAFKQKKANKLLKLRTSSLNEEINHWLDFWLIKLKIEKNPFDKKIRADLKNFSKKKHLKFLTSESYKYWAHEIIKRENWDKTFLNLAYIKKVFPEIKSESIQCVNYLSNSSQTLSYISKLTYGEEFRIGCLKLVMNTIGNGVADKNFVLNSARSAAISGKLTHAQNILNFAKKNKFSVPFSEYKLLKVLAVSQKNSLRALRRLRLIRRALNSEQKSFGSMVVGSALLGITHPSAFSLVKKGIDSVQQQPVYILEASARVALRYGDWDLLKTVIESLPLKMQKLPKWKYWEAQRLLVEGEKNKSAKLLDSIKPPWSFYGMLSGEELARIYNPKKHIAYRIPIQEQNYMKVINSPSFKLALLFYDLGFYKEGRMQWESVLSNQSDRSLISISKYVSSINVIDRSISAALKTKNQHNFYLRFPTPFEKIVNEEASNRNISPFLMMSLMRQESRFKQKIISSAGAIGLMQLMPSTARSVARKINFKSISKKSLTDPKVNILLGSEYLKLLYSQFGNSALLTTASYNAGPSRSKKWKKSLITEISGAAFAESIPFDETREYVKSVLSGTVMYSRLYDKAQLDISNVKNTSFMTLQSLLGSVKPNPKKELKK